MIKIVINEKNKLVKSLIISGHANCGEYGKDIVCAGVSSIVVGGLNALTMLEDKNKIKALINEGYVEIQVDDEKSTIIQLILKVMIIQLESIEESYPKFIKIKR